MVPAMSQELIDELRLALEASPSNQRLRFVLAKHLSTALRYAEAETEFRRILEQSPHEIEAKIGLAQCFVAVGKDSAALVLLEDLVASGKATASAFHTFARVLSRTGESEKAGRMYRKAKEIDPALVDLALETLLPAKEPERARIALDDDGPTSAFEPEVERPKISFSAVGGMDDLKDEIRMKIILPLEKPELFAAYGKQAGGGILMYGPPGCGKTHLARATAGEIKASFISIGISDVLDMYIGQSEKNLAGIFAKARARKPCVLFFDEVDALAASRRDLRTSATRQAINQFLAELDGISSDNAGILILAATNAPWHLDPAFRRPGRFDRILFVPPPDESARASIMEVLLTGKPIEKVDLLQIARSTIGFSGADLKAVVEQTIEAKLREALKTGHPLPINTKDLLHAAKNLKPSTKDWFATARNHALYANESGLYDDVLSHLGIRK